MARIGIVSQYPWSGMWTIQRALFTQGDLLGRVFNTADLSDQVGTERVVAKQIRMCQEEAGS